MRSGSRRQFELSPAAVPVISVGNLAMGGRGKTPLVAHLTRQLIDAGERPAILSRGYRRRTPDDGVVIVSDGRHRLADLDRSGDEPLMLARSVPGAAVLVSESRTMSAALAESILGCTVIVLDDGFQHRAMRRDVDVVIVTSGDLTDHRLPFGRLRSPVSDLSRADAVVMDGPWTEAGAVALRAAISVDRTALFSLSRAIGEAYLIEQPDVVLTKNMPVVAVAGIARPQRFTESLEASGWQVARLLPFSDHHPYDREDLKRMAETLRGTGAAGIVTTEKDAVRLLPLRPLGMPVAAVPLVVDIATRAIGQPDADSEPLDTRNGFREWLLGRLRQVRA